MQLVVVVVGVVVIVFILVRQRRLEHWDRHRQRADVVVCHKNGDARRAGGHRRQRQQYRCRREDRRHVHFAVDVRPDGHVDVAHAHQQEWVLRHDGHRYGNDDHVVEDRWLRYGYLGYNRHVGNYRNFRYHRHHWYFRYHRNYWYFGHYWYVRHYRNYWYLWHNRYHRNYWYLWHNWYHRNYRYFWHVRYYRNHWYFRHNRYLGHDGYLRHYRHYRHYRHNRYDRLDVHRFECNRFWLDINGFDEDRLGYYVRIHYFGNYLQHLDRIIGNGDDVDWLEWEHCNWFVEFWYRNQFERKHRDQHRDGHDRLVDVYQRDRFFVDGEQRDVVVGNRHQQTRATTKSQTSEALPARDDGRVSERAKTESEATTSGKRKPDSKATDSTAHARDTQSTKDAAGSSQPTPRAEGLPHPSPAIGSSSVPALGKSTLSPRANGLDPDVRPIMNQQKGPREHSSRPVDHRPAAAKTSGKRDGKKRRDPEGTPKEKQPPAAAAKQQQQQQQQPVAKPEAAATPQHTPRTPPRGVAPLAPGSRAKQKPPRSGSSASSYSSATSEEELLPAAASLKSPYTPTFNALGTVLPSTSPTSPVSRSSIQRQSVAERRRPPDKALALWFQTYTEASDIRAKYAAACRRAPAVAEAATTLLLFTLAFRSVSVAGEPAPRGWTVHVSVLVAAPADNALLCAGPWRRFRADDPPSLIVSAPEGAWVRIAVSKPGEATFGTVVGWALAQIRRGSLAVALSRGSPEAVHTGLPLTVLEKSLSRSDGGVALALTVAEGSRKDAASALPYLCPLHLDSLALPPAGVVLGATAPAHVFTFTVSHIQFAFPLKDHSIPCLLRRIAADWDLDAESYVEPSNLRVELTAHSGVAALSKRHTVPLAKAVDGDFEGVSERSIRGEVRKEVYAAAEPKGGFKFRLPTHADAAVVLQVVCDVRTGRPGSKPDAGTPVVLAHHVHLACPNEARTEDGTEHVQLNAFRGPFVNHDGVPVSDAAGIYMATPKNAPYTRSVVLVEYDAATAGTLHGARLREAAAELKAARKREKRAETAAPPPPPREAASRPKPVEPPAKAGKAAAPAVREIAAGGSLAGDAYVHMPYCNGSCDKKCNFTAPRLAEPKYPAPPHEVQVVAVEPEALFLEPPYALTDSDRSRLSAFPFYRAPADPEAWSGIRRVDSKITVEFQALHKPTADCPIRFQFAHHFAHVGRLHAPAAKRLHDPDLRSAHGSGVHVLRPVLGANDAGVRSVVRVAPSTMDPVQAAAFDRYLAGQKLYVDVFDADTLFLWGTAEIDLFRIHRAEKEGTLSHVGEAAVLDPLGREVERGATEFDRPVATSFPELKAVLVYQLVNEPIASETVAAEPRPERVPARARHKVVAKKLVDASLDAALALHRLPDTPQPALTMEPGPGLPATVRTTMDEPAPSAEQVHFRCEATASAGQKQGWALASCDEANKYLQAVARAIDSAAGSWAICQLADGYVMGRGYGCVIKRTGAPEPGRTYSVLLRRGPLEEADRRLLHDTGFAGLRRARAEFVKDQIFRTQYNKNQPLPQQQQQQQQQQVGEAAGKSALARVGPQASFFELEEKLEAVARLKAFGKRKEDMLRAQIQAAITKEVVIRPSCGVATLLELDFRNPFAFGYTFTIDIRDEHETEELTVVTSLDAWRELALHQKTPPPSNVVPDARGRVFVGNDLPLGEGEAARVPCQFLSYADGIAGPGIAPRSAVVYIRDKNNTPRAVFQVKIVPLPVTIDRTVRLHGIQHETCCRWVPVGAADDADERSYTARRKAVCGAKKKLKSVRCTAPRHRYLSFVDWQNTKQGSRAAVEVLQVEGTFPAAGSEESVLLFFYGSDAFVPVQCWRVDFVACTLISGIKRNMGESSNVFVPLTDGISESKRQNLKFGVGHGLLGQKACAGDWLCKAASQQYSPQGFCVKIRPVDDTPRRILANAVIDEGGMPVLAEPYILLVQGVPRGRDPGAMPAPTVVPFKKTKAHSWVISHTNAFHVATSFAAVFSPHGDFHVHPRKILLQPGQSQMFTITFKPSMPQRYFFTLWINNEDDATVGFHRRVFDVVSDDIPKLEPP
ncbi:hypothetical protein DIPPA_12578 [Diplonema papillatum]|nr:hypothetical protein DIPPA_12578 [Diplonema papillatum]